jgi:hypothetical protein
MNTILIQKLKSAMKSSHPLEVINEIITEYDEIIKLAEWRKEILESGKNLKRNQKELNRIAKMLEESGYYTPYLKDDLEKDVREFFRNM